MPNDKHTTPGPSQDCEHGILKSLILLALPWLSLQRDLLAAIKRGLEDHKKEDIYIRPIQHLVHEMHAVLMVFDRARILRDRLDEDLEKKLVEELTQIVKKAAAGSVELIEAQEIVVTAISDVLRKLKDGNQPRSHAN